VVGVLVPGLGSLLCGDIRRHGSRAGDAMNQGLALLGAWGQLAVLLLLFGYFLLRGQS